MAIKKTFVGSLSCSTEFSVGDKVVYPAQGVCIIDAVQIRKVSGAEQSFYMLTVMETGMKIMVPVHQVNTVGLRKIVDAKTADKVYDILRDRDIVIDNQTYHHKLTIDKAQPRVAGAGETKQSIVPVVHTGDFFVINIGHTTLDRNM